MKATGIVRRIDELGRVVIPKEIRRTMRIREGDPLEIYTDRDGEVIFRKYSPIGELTTFATQYAESLNKTCNMNVIICDRDGIIAIGGVPKKDFMDRRISDKLDDVMKTRNFYGFGPGQTPIDPTLDGTDYYISSMMPIVGDGDIVGCVASLYEKGKSGHQVTEEESKLVQTAAMFLGLQMDS